MYMPDRSKTYKYLTEQKVAVTPETIAKAYTKL